MDASQTESIDVATPQHGDRSARVARTRRGFVGALLTALGSALLLLLLWLVSRGAPSAGRDPEFTPPALP